MSLKISVLKLIRLYTYVLFIYIYIYYIYGYKHKLRNIVRFGKCACTVFEQTKSNQQSSTYDVQLYIYLSLNSNILIIKIYCNKANKK